MDADAEALAGFTVTGAAFLVAALALIGPSGLATYVDVLLHGQTELLGRSPDTMVNLYSLPANFGIESKLLNALLAVSIVAMAIYGLRRANVWRGLAIASTASLLISPHAFGYDATLLLLPLWLTIEFSKRKLSRYTALLVATPVIFFFTLAPQPLRCVPALALLAFLVVTASDRTEAAELGARAETLPDVGREVPRLAEAHPFV